MSGEGFHGVESLTDMAAAIKMTEIRKQDVQNIPKNK